MRALLVAGVSAVVLAGSAASAAKQPSAVATSAEYGRCLDHSHGVTVDMHSCAAAEDARQAARLNANYRALMARLSPDRTALLRRAERAWIEFRKDHCDFEASSSGGGTFEPIAIDDCYAELTAERANVLKSELETEVERGPL